MASSKADVLESLDLANRALDAAIFVAQGLPDPPPPPPPPDTEPPPEVVRVSKPTLAGIGIYDVNDSGLHNAAYRFGWRLVVDEPCVALILPFRKTGTDWSEAPYGGTGHTYGDGTGGRIRITRHPDMDGKPELATVLGTDEWAAKARWDHTLGRYGITQGTNQFWRVLMPCEPGVWWIVARNVDTAPSKNYISPNSPIGPGRSSLDPREIVAWSPDSGNSWQFGRNAGHYQSAYARMPWWGLERADGTRVVKQGYYGYKENASGSGVDRVVAVAGPLTKLIVHGPSPGTVSARNQRTDQRVTIPSQNGYQEHAIVLDAQAGDKIELSASGSLYTAEADVFIRQTYPSLVDEVPQIAVI